MARLDRIKGQTLVAAGRLYDPEGLPGIWDIIHERIGCRNTPTLSSCPWTVFAKTGVMAAFYPNGRVALTAPSARIRDIQEIEDIIKERMQGAWIATETFDAPASNIEFGRRTTRTARVAEAPHFH